MSDESRGWTQVEVNLSKPAESHSLSIINLMEELLHKMLIIGGGQMKAGYRQITFLEGQSNAVINLDVRWDDVAEDDETFNIDMVVASGSEDQVISWI